MNEKKKKKTLNDVAFDVNAELSHILNNIVFSAHQETESLTAEIIVT